MEIQNTRIGTIKKRYKRFLADVVFDNGEEATVYVPNTGSMKACWEVDWKIAAQLHEGSKRKYPYSLEMTHNGESWIGINTSLTNSLVQEALENNIIAELKNYNQIKTEVKIGKSRLDFCLSNENEKYYLEVKNVTLKEGTRAQFPDAISTRGQKHLQELIDLVQSGTKAGLLFVVQRQDVNSFDPKNSIDSKYTELLIEAHARGVDILCYQCTLSPENVVITNPLPIDFT